MSSIKLIFIANCSSPLARRRYQLVKDSVNPEVAFFFDPFAKEVFTTPDFVCPFVGWNRYLRPILSYLLCLKLIFTNRINVLHYHGGAHLIFNFLPVFGKRITTPQGSEINQSYVGWKRIFVGGLIRISDFVTVKSPFMRKLCKNILSSEKNIVDLNWGIDPEFFATQPVTSSDEISIISYRASASLYNIPLIFEAVKELKKQFPIKFTYIEFGKQPSIDLDLGVCDEHHKHVTKEALIQLLRKTDIMISIPKFDGFATSIMESLAIGCYPLISELPSYENFLDGQTNSMMSKIDLAKERALVEGLKTACKNIETIRENRELRRQYARHHYNLSQQVEILREIYLK
jgi:glycosyltransferase involved in cell wall biosynthesis